LYVLFLMMYVHGVIPLLVIYCGVFTSPFAADLYCFCFSIWRSYVMLQSHVLILSFAFIITFPYKIQMKTLTFIYSVILLKTMAQLSWVHTTKSKYFPSAVFGILYSSLDYTFIYC
jgi:hypothetical protein